MKRRDFIQALSVSTCLLGLDGIKPNFGLAEEKSRKILYFDLSTEWEHPPTVDEEDGTSKAAKIVKRLGNEIGYEVDCTKDGSVFDGDLSQYAAFVFFTCGDLDVKVENRIPVSEAGREALFKAIRSGAGFLGIHCATDTWQCKGELFENQPIEERTDYIKMVGGDFITHGDMQEAKLTLVEPIELPVLKELGKSEICVFDEWYCMKNFNPDMHVLIVQQTEGMKNTERNSCYDRPAFPSTWVRMEGKGRVAYMAPGHGNEQWDTDFVKGLAQDLMRFIVGQIDLDMTPNMKDVAPDAYLLRYPSK